MTLCPRRLLVVLCCILMARAVMLETTGMEDALHQLSAQIESMEVRLNKKIAQMEARQNDKLASIAEKMVYHKDDLKEMRSLLETAFRMPPTTSTASQNFTAPSRNIKSRVVPKSASARTASPIPHKALHAVVGRGDAKTIRRLLDSGANTRVRDSHGDTALHTAAHAGHIEAVETLLRFGADPNTRGHHLQLPLHRAAAQGHLQVTQRLVESGTQIDVRDVEGSTALLLAAQSNHKEVFEFLLSQNSSVHYRNTNSDLHLLSAVQKRNLERTRASSERNASSTAPLVLAARDGRIELLERLLLRGAVKDTEELQEALEVASGDDIVWTLAQMASDLLDDVAWQTALFQAAHDGRKETLIALLNAGANSNVKDEEGRTVLEMAAQKGHTKCVVSLLRFLNRGEEREKGVRLVLGITNSSDIILALGDVAPDVIRGPVGGEAIRNATRMGQCQLLNSLLTAGADVDHEDRAGKTVIDLAAEDGKSDCIAYVLQHDSSSDKRNDHIRQVLNITRSPDVVQVVSRSDPELLRGEIGAGGLRSAAASGRCEIIESLLTARANVTEDSTGNTALDLAARNNHAECIGPLLKRDGQEASESDVRRVLNVTKNIEIVRALSETAPGIFRGALGSEVLMQAAQDGECELLGVLLEIGVDAKHKNNAGNTAVQIAAQNGHVSCVSMLRERGGDVLNGTQWEEKLRLAVRIGRAEVVAATLAAGVDPNAKDANGFTPLAIAVDYNQIGSVQELLKGGADKEARISTWYNATILIRATAKRRAGVVRALLVAGANPNGMDGEGDTALYWALSGCNAEIASALLQAGANVTRKGSVWEPLHFAAVHGCTELVRVLLRSGANVEAKTETGSTALSWACNKGYLEIVLALLEAGANVGTKIKDGWTPLHVAAWKGHANVVRLLLEKGASVATTDDKGNTAIAYAETDEIRQLLAR